MTGENLWDEPAHAARLKKRQVKEGIGLGYQVTITGAAPQSATKTAIKTASKRDYFEERVGNRAIVSS